MTDAFDSVRLKDITEKLNTTGKTLISGINRERGFRVQLE